MANTIGLISSEALGTRREICNTSNGTGSNRGWVEHHDVGPCAFSKLTTIDQVE
jgi:hypothetical protein